MQKITAHKNELDAKVNVFLKKTALQDVYESFYAKMHEHCNEFGKTLEIGSASGKSKNSFKNIFLSDVVFSHHSDTVCDAHFLPFKNKNFSNIIAIDTFHHLENPLMFVKEASRILTNGGRMALIEPLVTPISQIVYKFFHDEDCSTNINPFQINAPDQKRNPLKDGNNGLPTAFFLKKKDSFHKEFPELKIVKFQRLSLFVYPLTGGYKNWCLIPSVLVKSLLKVENFLLPLLGRLMALRMLVVIEKRK